MTAADDADKARADLHAEALSGIRTASWSEQGSPGTETMRVRDPLQARLSDADTSGGRMSAADHWLRESGRRHRKPNPHREEEMSRPLAGVLAAVTSVITVAFALWLPVALDSHGDKPAPNPALAPNSTVTVTYTRPAPVATEIVIVTATS